MKPHLALFFALLFALLFPAAALAQPELNDIGDAMQAVQAIEASWERADGTVAYPDDFCGFYYKGNTLVVMLTTVTETRKAELRALCANPNAVTFEQAKYSLNDLNALAEALEAEREAYPFSFVGCTTVAGRCVTVWIEKEADLATTTAYFQSWGDKVVVTATLNPPQTGSAGAPLLTGAVILLGLFCLFLPFVQKYPNGKSSNWG